MSQIRVLMAVVVLCAALASPEAGQATQSTDDSVESEDYGVALAWGDEWEVLDLIDEGGVLQLFLGGLYGELFIRAAPAFGGNENICLRYLEESLHELPAVEDIEVARDSLELHLEGGSSQHLTADYRLASGEIEVWEHIGWCHSLQPGYSTLVVELGVPSEGVDEALEAAESLVVELTDPPPAPDFDLPDERDDMTSFWTQQFEAWDLETYLPPSYVQYTGKLSTFCGTPDVLDVGPHYCWPDYAVFIDQVAAQDFEARYGTAINVYFLAHETGHHVQNLLGIDVCTEAECLTETTDRQLELMADCFAGAWMASAVVRGVMHVSEFESALVGIADALGDPGHGDASLRLWWTLQGYHLGVEMCFSPGPEGE